MQDRKLHAHLVLRDGALVGVQRMELPRGAAGALLGAVRAKVAARGKLAAEKGGGVGNFALVFVQKVVVKGSDGPPLRHLVSIGTQSAFPRALLALLADVPASKVTLVLSFTT